MRLRTGHICGMYRKMRTFSIVIIARGVQKKEIAFIHEYGSEEKKNELFAKVRKGDVRVLPGSTAKMGSGINFQNKLIALHDLDAPWRPDDVDHTLRKNCSVCRLHSKL